MVEWHTRRNYYRDVLIPVAGPLLCRLATLDGLFDLYCREIAPRFEIEEATEPVHKRTKTIMVRHHVFHKWEELCDYLVKKSPATLQYGGIYPVVGTDLDRKEHFATLPAFGELIFDVDADEYDRSGVCGCGKERAVCDICWKIFVEPGRRVLDYILRNVLGFTAIFYVFSGRRGFHAWVLDKTAIQWTPKVRANMATRIQNLLVDDEDVADVVFDILQPGFDEHFWKKLSPTYAGYSPPDLRAIHRKLVFDKLYPKLDIAVSRDEKHLHKLPFFPHQTTGFVGLPLPPVSKGHLFSPSKHSIHYTKMTKEMLKVMLVSVTKAVDQIDNKK